jgi:hypothetical protein
VGYKFVEGVPGVAITYVSMKLSESAADPLMILASRECAAHSSSSWRAVLEGVFIVAFLTCELIVARLMVGGCCRVMEVKSLVESASKASLVAFDMARVSLQLLFSLLMTSMRGFAKGQWCTVRQAGRMNTKFCRLINKSRPSRYAIKNLAVSYDIVSIAAVSPKY